MKRGRGTPGGDRAGTQRRRRTVRAISLVAVVLAALALTLSYLGRAVLRPGPFADRAVAALRDPAVQADVADRLTVAVTQALIAAGTLLLLESGAVLALAVPALGLYVLYWGIAGAVSAAVVQEPRIRGRVARSFDRARRVGPAALVLAAVVVPVVVLSDGSGDDAPAATRMTCNGYAALCSRPLNDVALAATHNSMASVSIPNWLFGQQDGTIADQLREGVRGLLIDTYYGFAVAGRVRTDLESLPKLKTVEQEIGVPQSRRRCGFGRGWDRGPAASPESSSVMGSASWAPSRSRPRSPTCARSSWRIRRRLSS
jgi:hypothetical protein